MVKSPTFTKFHEAQSPIFLLVNTHHFFRDFFSASRPWRSSTCQRCCCYRSHRDDAGWFASWIRKYHLLN
jgi:hypothetical protein